MKATDIQFHKYIKGISVEEYRYWRSMFDKLLKIGVELEFNLKIKRGTCKGFNVECVCDHYDECKPIKCCFHDGETNTCSLFFNIPNECSDGDCKKTCSECDKIEYIKCNGVRDMCVSYYPACVVCDSNTVNCKGCNDYVHNRQQPNIIRKTLASKLEATNNFGDVGSTGVLQVVKDGSLINGGLEIPTVGRRYDFQVFKEMISTIITKARSIGGYIDSRCSLHVHILNEYYTKTHNNNGNARHPDEAVTMSITGLERKFPNIILYNVLQIWRRYEEVFFWMSMGLSDASHMTRWSKFRYPVKVINPMLGLREFLATISRNVGNDRYGSLNIKNSLFNGGRFHIEFRVMDFINSPTYISAMCALFRAVVIKAIDVSVIGIIDTTSGDSVKNSINKLLHIANGYDKGYDSDRLADTTKVLNNVDYYVNKGHEMLDFLSTILTSNLPETQVLRAIVDKPPAMYYIEAPIASPENDFDIESVYSSVIEDNSNDTIYNYICSIVALGNITGCRHPNDWISEVYDEYANDSVETKDKLEQYINDMTSKGIIVWDEVSRSFKHNI